MVQELILACAPERQKELSLIWQEYGPVFAQARDKRGFSFDAGPYGLILFTLRSMQEMWVLGFAAQHAFYEYSAIVIWSVLFGSFQPEILSLVSTTKYASLLNHLESLRTSPDFYAIAWPNDLPRPEQGKPTDMSGAMTFDLLCMAAAYSFLHEVQHVKFSSGRHAPTSPHEEELLCDEFARAMLLDKIEQYATISGYPLRILKTKRAMSIGLASFFLLVLTPIEAWGGSRSHPPVAQRIQALADSLLLPDTDDFWIYLASLVIAQLRYCEILIRPIKATSVKAFCTSLFALLPNK